jgi:hypothetical protein
MPAGDMLARAPYTELEAFGLDALGCLVTSDKESGNADESESGTSDRTNVTDASNQPGGRSGNSGHNAGNDGKHQSTKANESADPSPVSKPQMDKKDGLRTGTVQPAASAMQNPADIVEDDPHLVFGPRHSQSEASDCHKLNNPCPGASDDASLCCTRSPHGRAGLGPRR